MDRLLQDLRFALRSLARGKGVTVAAILALALGVGANSALFSVVDAVLLRPLPFKDPERIVRFYGNFPKQDLIKIPVSVPEHRDLARQPFLEARGAFTFGISTLVIGSKPERIQVGYADSGLFDALGVAPALGRNFTPEETNAGHANPVLLTHRLWRLRFNADPTVLGRALRLDGQVATVVGVLPEGFDLLGPNDLFSSLALTADQQSEQQRGSRYFTEIGRLKAGATLEQLQKDLPRFSEELRREHPDNYRNGDWHLTASLLREDLIGDTRTSLLVLLGAVAFVLLIACANVANLMLARAAGRSREIAVRAALGAQRFRLIRQLLTESTLLSLVGGGVGLLIAVWGVDALVAVAPDGIPGLATAQVNGRVVAFTLIVSLAVGLGFGLAPALHSTRGDLVSPLKEGARSGTTGGRLRASLVVCEVALALVLLIGAGLTLRSFARLLEVRPGFDAAGVVTMRVLLSGPAYQDAEGNPRQSASKLFKELFRRASILPGVESVGATSQLPLLGRQDASYQIEGYTPPPGAPGPDSEFRSIAPDFFKSLRIPMLRGRAFSEQDGPDQPKVIIVSEALARRYFPDQDPIGRRIRLGRRPPLNGWRTIVGVVADVRDWGLDQPVRTVYYVPIDQYPVGLVWLTLRSKDASAKASALKAMANQVRPELAALDSDQALEAPRTLEEDVSASTAGRRFPMQLLALFAGLALLLSAIGIYGVMSYAVEQRTHEIGVRMAVGARAADVLKLVVGQGLKLALYGVAIGLVAALGLSRVLGSLLYNVSASDPLTFAGIAALLVLVALVACWLPARRAVAVDPMTALRSE